MKLFSTTKAAEYVGLSLSAFKYHIHIAKTIEPFQKIGHSLAFTQDQLDEFQANRRPQGRPSTKGQDNESA